MRSWLLVLSLTVVLPQPSSLHERIAVHVKSEEAALVALRRDLHSHPELSGQEVRTATVVLDRLKALGLEVRPGVGGHGVVGILTGGRPGPLVAYRADMDAVRSTDPDPVDFPSVWPGLRHICGHDLHVTIGLGLASALAAVKADLPGRVMFIFQPAEERATGARAMVDAGLFAKEKPAAIFGVHTAPMDVGILSSRAGRMMLANGTAPGVVNDKALFESSRSDLTLVMGAQSFTELSAPPPGFSEDFGEFQMQVPGMFFFLGASNTAKGVVAMPHSPGFAIDEAAIPFGIRAMAAVVVGRLSK